MKKIRILVINPGSTSTKIAVYDNTTQICVRNVQHQCEDLEHFAKISDQYEYRKALILKELENYGIDIKSVDLVMGRGGLLKPIQGGVYRVNEAMLNDIRNPMAEHESNLGGIIAYEIAQSIGKNVEAYIVDPTCVDEMQDLARISGLPELPRRSFLHALNQKAVARKFAMQIGKLYEEINVIVAHMGGGISVGAHQNGMVIDVNNGLNGDGPFSPERCGSVPVGQFAELCFSGKFTFDEIKKKIKGKGGLMAYLGTNDACEVEEKINQGDQYAKLIYNAMAYQVAKEIGSLSTVLKGKVEAILLTGGVAHSKYLTDKIRENVDFITTVYVFPGEGEMESLAFNGYLVRTGEITPKIYV